MSDGIELAVELIDQRNTSRDVEARMSSSDIPSRYLTNARKLLPCAC